MLLYRLAQIAQELGEQGYHDAASDLDSAVSDIETAQPSTPTPAPKPQVAPAPTVNNNEQSHAHPKPDASLIANLVQLLVDDFKSAGIAPEELITPEGQRAFRDKLMNVVSAGEEYQAKSPTPATSQKLAPLPLNQP